MNKTKLFISFLFLLILLVAAGSAAAQQSNIYTDKDRDYKTASELFAKRKYAAAQQLFLKTAENNTDIHSEIKLNSLYYAALCAIELFNDDAEQLMLDFINRYPGSPKVQRAYFDLAKHHYRRKKFEKALEWFEKTDVNNLSADDAAEYYFKSGYSYFEENNYEAASEALFEIKEVDTRYTAPARYYYSHIAYNQKNYETALQGFLKLEKDENFGPVVPYYISQIYYLQGKYDKVIEYAPGLLDSANTKRVPEIARLIGESYYKTKRYNEAIPYLEQYRKSFPALPREDAYQLGYAYYKNNQCDKAIELLKTVTGKEDSLTQTAYYNLGECYLAQQNKQAARAAFKAASKYKFDEEIYEDALYTYAKLSYELAFNPYNEAIEAFQTYLKEFPDSPRRDEAQSYLVNVFLTTKNYRDAITAIESIKNRTRDLDYAYQKIAYFRGVELFNAGNYTYAINHFNKALNYQLDKSLTAQSLYWRGEANYMLKKYDDAIASYKEFIFEPGAVILPEYATSNYNLGYAYFKKKDYPSSISWFRKYLTFQPADEARRINDALLRIADSYFISKDYYAAADFYDQAVRAGTLNNDYALFQKSISLGLTGKPEQKITALESLIASYPESAYADDAKFELGKTYQSAGNNESALRYYKMLVEQYPSSSYVKKALVQQALVHYNTKEDDKALALYKKVVSSYPSSPEAFEALAGIKNIYIAGGKAEEYAEYVEEVPFANVSRTSLDSTAYEAAEITYMKGDCGNAVRQFENYLNKYTEGIYRINAQFYKAECYLKLNQQEKALEGYNYVAEQPLNMFTEKALVKAGNIYYNQKDYAAAASTYQKLEGLAEQAVNIQEAQTGLMKSNYRLNKISEAATYAQKVLQIEKASETVRNEANLVLAKADMQAGRPDEALAKFNELSAKARNEIGAEAKYNTAEILYSQQKYKESEKVIFELAEQFSSYDYWVAKGFILLADNYMAMNDSFQAKATLQSIIDNYEGEELKKTAQEKLDKIIEAEKPAEQPEQEPIEIELNDSQGGMK